MGTVVVHAGMPKTGSTSIQAWLAASWRVLRERGITLVHDDVDDGELRLRPFESALTCVSNAFLLQYWFRREGGAPVDELRRQVDDFVAAVDAVADAHGTVVLTAEGFSTLFLLGDEPVVCGFEELASRHAVRIAYYVRPQHTAIESRWRQWGFRTGDSPAAFARKQLRDLDYLDTRQRVRGLAPSLDFVVRPFRRDLLTGGDVVEDFARTFLGLDDPPPTDGFDENPSVPLDLAILLRGAPPAVLSDGPVDTGARQQRLGGLARAWAVPESDAAQRSRALLQRFAHAEFEPRNRTLITELGWATDAFVPAPPGDAPTGPVDLDELDQLWGPQASPAALGYLHAALAAVLDADADRGR